MHVLRVARATETYILLIQYISIKQKKKRFATIEHRTHFFALRTNKRREEIDRIPNDVGSISYTRRTTGII